MTCKALVGVVSIGNRDGQGGRRTRPLKETILNKLETITLGGGCFWWTAWYKVRITGRSDWRVGADRDWGADTLGAPRGLITPPNPARDHDRRRGLHPIWDQPSRAETVGRGNQATWLFRRGPWHHAARRHRTLA